jgi:hypothetical protein
LQGRQRSPLTVELSGGRKVTEMGQRLRLFAARTGCELVMQPAIARRLITEDRLLVAGPRNGLITKA